MKIRHAIIIFAIFLIIYCNAYGQSLLIERIENGFINWGDGSIITSAIVKNDKDSKETAIAACNKNLKQIITQIRINNDDKAINHISQENILSLEGITVEQIKFFADGSVLATAKLNLFGDDGALGILYPALTQIKGEEEPEKNNETRIIPKKAYSGLIIDARKYDILPSISPKILSTDGRDIYNISMCDENSAIDTGIVQFCSKIGAAKLKKNRIGNNPLIITASKQTKKGSCDVLISQKDFTKIQKAVKYYDFLKSCRVIFVI